MRSLHTGISFAFLATLAALPRPVAAQQDSLITLGVRAPEHSQSLKAPSNISLALRSIRSSSIGSLIGGVAGLAVDNAYCERHHGKEPSFLFGPCFLYANEGFGTGWFGGAIVGSAYGAMNAATKRGCPRDIALLRAVVGASLGAAPGVIIVAKRAGKYPPSRSVLIASAPLVSAFGAAAAVGGCHGS
jgi:hypothetical protein